MSKKRLDKSKGIADFIANAGAAMVRRGRKRAFTLYVPCHGASRLKLPNTGIARPKSWLG